MREMQSFFNFKTGGTYSNHKTITVPYKVPHVSSHWNLDIPTEHNFPDIVIAEEQFQFVTCSLLFFLLLVGWD